MPVWDPFDLARLLESSSLGIAFLDADLRYVRINEKLAAMNGRPAAEHVGRTLREIVPHLAPWVEPLCRGVLKTGQPILDVVMAGEPAGGPGDDQRWLASYSPLRGEDARVVGVSVIVLETAGLSQRAREAEERRTEEIRQAGAEIHTLKEQLEQDIRDRQRAEDALRSSRSSVETLAGRLLTIQEEERRTLARELHDDLTQRLAVQSIALGQLVGRRGARCRQCTATLAGISSELAKLSEDIHAISRQLHPSILDDLGLADALRSECSAFSRREGIAVSYRIQDLPASVPRDAAICVYRIAQEGLRNVAKHARVKEAEVTLCREGSALTLTVRDAGVGFHVGNGTGTVGIASMAERARLVQGEFDVQSQPGKGTVVRVRIPLRSSRP